MIELGTDSAKLIYVLYFGTPIAADNIFRQIRGSLKS